MLRSDPAVNRPDRHRLEKLKPQELTKTNPLRNQEQLHQAVWGFVALGVFLRVTRYLLNFPLWHDEAFVAVNFIEKSYLDMLGRLDYHQVCPLLFLWIELSIVKLLGFSEWSLRLFPTLCAVSSLFLFRHVANRVLDGWPKLLAVAIFAVSFFPIRHGGEVKPYASDLLVALGLLAITIEWQRSPERSRWLWGLAAFVPIALLLSHPSVFVAGGIGLAILTAVWRSNRWMVRAAYVSFGFLLSMTFLGLLFCYTGTPQSEELRRHYLTNYWADSFPPLNGPVTFVLWFLRMHSGNMLAYPLGGENGASSLTMLCLVLGSLVIWKQRRNTLLLMLLLPFGLGLVAAALGRYPYGGEARIMQYLAPSICLLTGLGAAALLSSIGAVPRRQRVSIGVVVILALLGVGQFAKAIVVPYHIESSARAREFARWFWTEQTRVGEVVCLKSDLGLNVEVEQWQAGISAEYLCNRQIYNPQRRLPGHSSTVLPEPKQDRPMRCVLYHVHWFESPEQKPGFLAWLDAMTSHHELKRRDTYTVNANKGLEVWKEETYIVYEFVPQSKSLQTHQTNRETVKSPLASALIQ